MKVDINANIMDINNAYATKNRELLEEKGILVINIMGSPGAGKTTLLERLLTIWQQHFGVAVIEGDLATSKDAERIKACGAQVVQINTDGGCHLDAKMITQVLPGFDLDQIKLVIIENVGNLVCPAGFDLGEDIRMVVLSTAEGSDKPAKYPSAILAADWVVINKLDLLDFTDFDLDNAVADIRQIKPAIRIFNTVARDKTQGIDQLAAAVSELVEAKASK